MFILNNTITELHIVKIPVESDTSELKYLRDFYLSPETTASFEFEKPEEGTICICSKIEPVYNVISQIVDHKPHQSHQVIFDNTGNGYFDTDAKFNAIVNLDPTSGFLRLYKRVKNITEVEPDDEEKVFVVPGVDARYKIGELIYQNPFDYNTCIMYDAQLFHAEFESQLIQVFHFK